MQPLVPGPPLVPAAAGRHQADLERQGGGQQTLLELQHALDVAAAGVAAIDLGEVAVEVVRVEGEVLDVARGVPH